MQCRMATFDAKAWSLVLLEALTPLQSTKDCEEPCAMVHKH